MTWLPAYGYLNWSFHQSLETFTLTHKRIGLQVVQISAFYTAMNARPFAWPAGFDSQEWYTQLFDYGLQPDANGAGPKPSAEDEELVPALVRCCSALLSSHPREEAFSL